MGLATAIILAAGKGTRMRSLKPKVLHEVCGTTLLEYVVEALHNVGIQRTIVIVGDRKEAVKECLKGRSVEFVEQKEQLGTADAVKSTKHLLVTSSTDTIIILNGDTPFIKDQTLRRLLVKNAETNADVTILTAYLDNLQEYGRISRDYKGCIRGIIESGEASTDELKIEEINVGIYVFRVSSLLEGMDLIVPHNKKGEFYLTDIIAILYNKGKKIENIVSENTAEVMGINNQHDLAVANKLRSEEIICSLMERGVTIIDTPNTFIENHVEIGQGTEIYPFTYICKDVVIGQRCSIGPFAYLKSGTRIGDDIKICYMM
ncbi:MAG TPA: NTP transferase domain-containing protein [Candidatus Wujingus californicus]|uniref:NTP transferase domain-containing protein n=1 Tax=Candidatus Wujingus californicus TaxID=3367618 RepID=UPI001DB6227A|nr:NTP transferase domain-containing protein [Planctomycetota bacterium]MDO8130359.1 NTP transferase domain-containing protein [Candidatus Brocadiales bacterium]